MYYIIGWIVDPSRFRFTHQTSFVKRHMGLSSVTGVRWIVSFFIISPSHSPVQTYLL
jgi:hypothetical protein